MKMESARITKNDDGTYQVECCSGNGFETGHKDLKYSAKDLADVAKKIGEAEKEFAGMKKGKGDKKNSVSKFLDEDEEDEE
jgi:hypothetical protein